MSNLLFNTGSGAKFSDCGKYRFALWRIWDENKPLVMFIGLNPSTANAYTDDATIRRVKRFAADWGYGGVYMMNCFPYISTDPQQLKDFGNTSENDKWMHDIAGKCSMIIFAWGNFEIARARGKELAALFPGAHALQINKNGSPKHPLYCAGDLKPILYQKTNVNVKN